jgi:hypothetical protein
LRWISSCSLVCSRWPFSDTTTRYSSALSYMFFLQILLAIYMKHENSLGYIYYICVSVQTLYNSQTETLHGLCPAMGFFLQFASFLCPLDSNPWPRGQYRSVLENAGGNWTVYIYIYGHCL